MRSVLLLVPSLGIDELRRCERVILDVETHLELRLAATWSRPIRLRIRPKY